MQAAVHPARSQARSQARAQARSQGRPQDAELTERILEETLATLRAGGLPGLRIEQVAAAVGCGKNAIYRRWKDRGELAAAALTRHSTLGEMPDTGDIRTDLLAHVEQNVRNQRAGLEERAADGPLARDASLWSVVTQPEVREHFWAQFLDERRARGRALLLRAVERGQLPPTAEIDIVLDLLAGFAFYRHTIRDVAVRRPDLEAVIAALVVCPPVRPGDPT